MRSNQLRTKSITPASISVSQSCRIKYYVSTFSEKETLAETRPETAMSFQWNCKFPQTCSLAFMHFSPGFTAIFPLCMKGFVYVSTYLWTPNDPQLSFHSSLCYFPQHGREWSDERRGKANEGRTSMSSELSSAFFFISFHLSALHRDFAIKESNHKGTYYFLLPWKH